MKNRKNKVTEKAVMIILCILLCTVAFCGCSNTQQNDAAVSDTSLEIEQQSEEITEEIAEEPEEVKEEFVLSVGEWNGNKYTNESIGITLELPDDWMYYDYARLAEFNMIQNAENMTLEQYEEAAREGFLNNGCLFLAETFSNLNSDNVSIVVYDAEWFSRFGVETAEEFANEKRKRFEEQYILDNYNYQLSDVKTMEICGITFYYFDDMKSGNSGDYERHAYALCDGYSIDIAIYSGYHQEDRIEEYCSFFK